MINFTINGQAVSAKKGDTILNVARRENIYIPTMCYLEKCEPISSCRLCVVDVEGVEGMVLSCQTPPTEGIKVTTSSSQLEHHRKNIMKLYDVNHPLECGVCDKSGACELQNKTVEFGVSSQEFSAREQKRDIKDWGLINYDPNLCILCERCTHVCNEIIGDDAIEIKYGGYNSSIIPKGSETLDCTYCGECISVCPVGALISNDFKYSSNAWELSQTPSACAHCSAGCALTYEVKHAQISNSSQRAIYRVSNDFENTTICGAGRFKFDFANTQAKREDREFQIAVEAFKKADTISFSSYITNEEALMLQKLKESRGVKLYNPEAKAYQNFINSFSSSSGKSLYSGTLGSIALSDNIVVLGSRIATDNPAVRYGITTASKQNRAKITYMHPIEDALLQNVVTKFIKYEVGAEEGVMALLMRATLSNKEISATLKNYIDSLDEGYLSSESNVGEEEFAQIAKELSKSKKSTLIVGEDLINHPSATNIAKMVGLIDYYGDFEVLIVPPKTNSLGVALICDLDEKQEGYSVGYNAQGDFILSATKEADFPIGALNQQEGSMVTLERRVVPVNVAVPFGGYFLNDIANALGLNISNTVDYTKLLPVQNGFKRIDFDNLENFFIGDIGEDTRGYELSASKLERDEELNEVEDLPEFNGTVLYRSEPVNQFSPFTAVVSQSEESYLMGSEQFALAAKITDGQKVKIESTNTTYSRVFKIDTNLKGTVALNPTFDMGLSAIRISSDYRYKKVKISKEDS